MQLRRVSLCIALALSISPTSSAQLAKPNTFFWSLMGWPNGAVRQTVFASTSVVPISTATLSGWTCRTSDIATRTLPALLSGTNSQSILQSADLICSAGSSSVSISAACSVSAAQVHSTADMHLKDGNGHEVLMVIGCGNDVSLTR